MNSRTTNAISIGFDASQTCETRAGCGWYADSLIRAMITVAPENRYAIYHRFGNRDGGDPTDGTQISQPHVSMPFLELSEKESRKIWNEVAAEKRALPGQPDIVQSNSFQAPLVGKAKLVVVVHDVSFWANPEFATEGNRLTCQRGILDALTRADGFIFVSHASHMEFERLLPSWLERNRKHHAVIHEAGRMQPVAGSPQAPGNGHWLAVGSLEPRKNYETLLDALEIYWPRSTRRLPLYLAGGKGWCNESLLARLSRMESFGMVKRLGYVPDEDLPTLYQSAQALVFPSWYEGFGLPVLEAMQCGCPVISSTRTSMAEIGGDAIIGIDPADSEAIAQAMLRMESEPALRDGLITAGLAQAEKFTWEKAAAATLDFYRAILAGPP
jgi:glycosyltransferase involved in cell wall biosynthesis